jgi:crossover junction endodeoxyribonuclease RusA
MVVIEIQDIPPSVNHYWLTKGKRRFISKRGKEWKHNVFLIANKKANKKYFNDTIEMDVEISIPDKRRRDIDNFSKAILDSLQGICYQDDCQIHRLILTKNFGKAKTVIKIKKYDS